MSVDQLIGLFSQHHALAAFCGAFLWGNSMTLLLATLAGQMRLEIWPLAIFAFAGNFLRDLLLFAVGRSRLVEHLISQGRLVRAHERLKALQARYSHRDWLLFLAVKFIYGLRWITILYFGSIKYLWRRFLLYDGFAALSLNVGMAMAGWLVGQGAGHFTGALKDLKDIATVLVPVLAIYWLVRLRAQKLMAGKSRQPAPPQDAQAAPGEDTRAH